MSFYSQAFRDLCADPYGEGIEVQAVIRRTDGENRLVRSVRIEPGFWGSHWYEAIEDSGAWTSVAKQTNWFYAFDTITVSPTQYDALKFLPIASATPWRALRNDILGLYDANKNVNVVLAGTITFSAVVYCPSTVNTPMGLGIYNSSIGATKKFRFNFTAGSMTGADVVDTDGKCGAIDLTDEYGFGWWHVWCCLDLAALGWNGNDLNLLHFPVADSADQYAYFTTVGGHQVAYNYDYDNAPEPKGIFTVVGLSPLLGEPGTQYELHGSEDILSMNPIKVKREERVGVSRASSFQITATNVTATAMGQVPISGAWMTVKAGFPQADVWAAVATGKIRRATMNTEGEVVFDCYDPVKDIIDGTLRRTVRFDIVASAGPINSQAVADGSSGYNNAATGAGVTGVSTQYAGEQQYRCVFDTPTTFEVYDEDDDASPGGPYNINADAVVDFGGGTAFTVQLEGWTQQTAGPTDHYAVDDEFVFDTSRGRASYELRPIELIQELITSERFMNLWIYDVETGAPFTTPFWDETVWDDVKAVYTDQIFSEFEQGTPIMDVIKQLLRVASASLYTVPSGQIAIFAALPIDGETVTLNGDPANGRVDILEASAEDDANEMYNIVKVSYLNAADKIPTSATLKSARSPLRTDRIFEIDCSNLELQGAIVQAIMGLFIRRVENPPRRFRARTTLTGMGIDMQTKVVIDEPWVGSDSVALTIEKTMDIMANEVEIVSSIDDYLLDDYAVVTDYDHDEYATLVGTPFLRKIF